MKRSVSLALVVLPLLVTGVIGSAASARDTERAPSRGLVIGYRSWGRLQLAMKPRQAWKTGMVSHQESLCAGGYLLKQPFQARAYLDWNITRTPWKVRSIVITGRRDHTSAGVHPGTTLAALRRHEPKLSKLTGSATLDGQQQPKKDLWVAWVSKARGTITYQFPYGAKPKAGSRLDTIIVSKKPVAWFGC